MSFSFDSLHDINTPIDYDSNSQDNSFIFQNINSQDRVNDLLSFSDEDNRIPSISNMFNEGVDNLIIEKHMKTNIEKKSSNKNLFEVNTGSFSESNSSKKRNKNSKLGRKRKNENIKGKHNKFSNDILISKCKHIILNSAFIFINQQIMKLYNNNIGDGYFKKQLLTLNKEPKSNTTTKYNKELLTKTLGEIFSENISNRYSNYSKQHNQSLIKELINEDNFVKRFYFQKLFSLTFLQCLKHFRGEETIQELEGMKLFNDIKYELNKDDDDDDNYIRTVEIYINTYEDIIYRKKNRKSRKECSYIIMN